MKTWKRNGVVLAIRQLPDGWWQAWVRDGGGVADAAICARPFPLLRAMARGFRRLALTAAVTCAMVALAGVDKWGVMCKSPPAPKGHTLSCPKGERPEWYCYVPAPGGGIHEPGEWSWQERCVPRGGKSK